jgi:putative FmdB family regulatory protein
MPTYEYRCPKGHHFELFQRISDEAGADCPECGEPAQRQISAGAGFLFKGDGFYITDSRSSDYKKKASSEGSETPKPSGDPGSSGSSSPSKAD